MCGGGMRVRGAAARFCYCFSVLMAEQARGGLLRPDDDSPVGRGQ